MRIVKILKTLLLLLAMIQLSGCREAFDPSIETLELNYLVVEGFINTRGVTTIQLTRTQKLAEAVGKKTEPKATVQIENDAGLVVGLTESGAGIYKSPVLNLPADKKYRLRIKTTGGKEYLSEYTQVRISPKLSVTWEKSSDGLRIYANSADPANQTFYYKYDFEETYELRSNEISLHVGTYSAVTRNVQVYDRPYPDQVDALICWKYTLSNNILTTSTKNLSKDVVDKFPLIFIPNGSEEIAVKYSILVKQYALTREAYDFFELMKKNSELLGSVFDPLPSTDRGNIKCVTAPLEPVIGYIVAASAEEERIFISKDEAKWTYSPPCRVEYVVNNQFNRNSFLIDDRFLISTAEYDYSGPYPVMKGFYVSLPTCLDCRKRKGNNNRPAYW